MESEQVRSIKRQLTSHQREFDRQIRRLEAQEKKEDAEFRKLASQGPEKRAQARAQHDMLKATRRSLASYRKMSATLSLNQLRIERSQLNGLEIQALQKLTNLLAKTNKGANPAQMQRLAMELQKQNDMMEQGQEMVAEQMEEMQEVDDETEFEDAWQKYEDERNIAAGQQLGATPKDLQMSTARDDRVAQAIGGSGGGGGDPGDDDLQARLNSLRPK